MLTNIKKSEEYITVHLGKESVGPEKKSVFETLQEVRLVGSRVSEDDYVTPASLIRLLSLR